MNAKPLWRDEIERAIDSYRQEVEQRRRITRHDPVADVLEWAANDLEFRLRKLSDPTAECSIEQYAAQEHVSVQTVRNWIHTGKIKARRTGRTWRIQPNAGVAA